MPAAYITIPGSAVKAEGDSILITKDEQTLESIECANLESLLLIGRVALTSPAMILLLKHRIPVSYMSVRGKLVGRLVPPVCGCIDARLAQYSLITADNNYNTNNSNGNQSVTTGLYMAGRVVQRKIQAMQSIIKRFTRNQEKPQKISCNNVLKQLKTASQNTQTIKSYSSLLGIEGSAAAAYFSFLPNINRSKFTFTGRSIRPPKDPLNAMLSFGYTMLTNEAWHLLDAFGLDPYLGFYHVPKPNKPALALDLIEPFRHAVVDRMVIKASNNGRFQPPHFNRLPNGGYRLERTALKRFLACYEQTMLAPADESLQPLKQAKLESPKHSARHCLRLSIEHLITWLRERARKHPLTAHYSSTVPADSLCNKSNRFPNKAA